MKTRYERFHELIQAWVASSRFQRKIPKSVLLQQLELEPYDTTLLTQVINKTMGEDIRRQVIISPGGPRVYHYVFPSQSITAEAFSH